jgi:hypothetical protein
VGISSHSRVEGPTDDSVVFDALVAVVDGSCDLGGSEDVTSARHISLSPRRDRKCKGREGRGDHDQRMREH